MKKTFRRSFVMILSLVMLLGMTAFAAPQDVPTASGDPAAGGDADPSVPPSIDPDGTDPEPSASPDDGDPEPSVFPDDGDREPSTTPDAAEPADVLLTGDETWEITEDTAVNNLTAASSAVTAAGPVTVKVHGRLILDGEEISVDATVGSVTYKLIRAYPSRSRNNIIVNGRKVAAVDAYALRDESGNETNYLKIRDLAKLLVGTAAEMNVVYNAALGQIEVATGEKYVSNGTEGSSPFADSRPYVSYHELVVDGEEAAVDAIMLTDNNGGGHTYFSLRSVQEILGITVDWNAPNIVIGTT